MKLFLTLLLLMIVAILNILINQYIMSIIVCLVGVIVILLEYTWPTHYND